MPLAYTNTERKNMDATELARKMLEWERTKRALDLLDKEIQAAVLEIGKTQTVGNIRASYSAGRKNYYYQATADGHPWVSKATISLFTTIIPQTETIDWRGICQHVGIEDISFMQSEPSVTVKLLVRWM